MRVGGGFVWPPTAMEKVTEKSNGDGGVKRVVFVAGGVGVNPLMSIVTFLSEVKIEKGRLWFKVVFLYSAKAVPENKGEVLFLSRLRDVFSILGEEGELRLFFTGKEGKEEVGVEKKRISGSDLLDALGPIKERKGTVCYICGVPTMTDAFVEKAKNAEGMVEENVLCEKWW